MAFRRPRGNRRELMAHDFRTLIAAKNASFFGDFGRPCTVGATDPENEAYLAAIRAQNAGLPNWRWVGRNSPRVSLQSWADRWELASPDVRALIEAKNASFFAI